MSVVSVYNMKFVSCYLLHCGYPPVSTRLWFGAALGVYLSVSIKDSCVLLLEAARRVMSSERWNRTAEWYFSTFHITHCFWYVLLLRLLQFEVHAHSRLSHISDSFFSHHFHCTFCPFGSFKCVLTMAISCPLQTKGSANTVWTSCSYMERNEFGF